MSMNRKEWETSFAARITEKAGADAERLAVQAAHNAAEMCAADYSEDVSLWPDPVDSADEELTYWED